MSSIHDEVDQLYQLLEGPSETLRSRYGRVPTPRDISSSRSAWGTKGVYFFFEAGEVRANHVAQRIVRIGSHRSDTASVERRIVLEHATDWGRSVFRRHVGTALIRKGAFDASIQPSDRDHWASAWYSHTGGWPAHTRPSLLHPTLHPLHPIVTRTIADMTVVWVEILDKEDRLALEGQCISLLSNCLRQGTAIDPPSENWLGRYALSDEVRRSGLWNVQHAKRPHKDGFLEAYQRYFARGK